MPTPTVWCETLPLVALRLRRYRHAEPDAEPDAHYHRAATPIGTAPVRIDDEGTLEMFHPHEYEGDDRWPTACDCGYEFTPDDRWQVLQDRMYDHPALGPTAQDDLPAGSMYDAVWLPWRGPDGIALTVVCPPGNAWSHWHVDGRANNCDQPDREHFCWVRHGDPRTEPVTVDKGAPGESCGAGAGSIMIGDEYHGFLRDGVLT